MHERGDYDNEKLKYTKRLIVSTDPVVGARVNGIIKSKEQQKREGRQEVRMKHRKERGGERTEVQR